MQINDILLLAQQKGIYNGSIKIPIVNGVLRLEKSEYIVLEWEKPRNIDGVVDNSKVNERTPHK